MCRLDIRASRCVLSHTDHCLNDLTVKSAVGLCPPEHNDTIRAADYTGLGLLALGGGWLCSMHSGLLRLEEGWFWQDVQASLSLEIGFSLNWRWKYLASLSHSVFAEWHYEILPCANPPNECLSADRRAIWTSSPAVKGQVMKSTACPAGTGSETHCHLMVGGSLL